MSNLTSGFPKYRLWRTGYSKEAAAVDASSWLRLDVGTPWGRFVVKASRSDLTSSADQLAEFEKHFETLSTPHGDVFKKNHLDLCPFDVLEWVLPALVLEQGQRGPNLRDMTLKEFWNKPWGTYRIKIEQGRLCAEPGEPISRVVSWAGLSLPRLENLQPFGIEKRNWSDFHVRAQVPGSVVCDLPRLVWLGDQCYRSRPFGNNEGNISLIIRKHQVINSIIESGRFFVDSQKVPALMTRAHYIIVDDNEQVVGLAIECPSGTMPLREALQAGRYVESQAAWKEQLRRTMQGLHNLNIQWAAVKLDNVLVREGEAWICEFGGAYRRSELDLFGGEGNRFDEWLLSHLFSKPLWRE
ncbi:hypothetical protein A9K55_005319 [Cordyceps militaris]|uniref:Protein kinase-like domain n=1 Tax=Cordyceps militaris TaxID=73501 RepID=A0A2H4SPD6_CORMI|nr:hypothetical protein A9K55_005319 [Cordyceps militaris]